MKARIFSRWLAVGLVLAALLPAGEAAAQGTRPPQRGKPPAPAPAPAPSAPASNHLGDAQGWSAFADPDRGGKVCYLVGRPVKSEPSGLKRGDVYVYVTHRSADKSYNVVSFTAGYPYREGSEVELVIDTQRFSLFTNKETAWARDAETEKTIVEAMTKGRQAVVRGTSTRGTVTTDTYSLAGFSQVLGLIDK